MAGMSFTGGSSRRWSSFAGAPRRGTSLRPGGSAYGGSNVPRTDGWEDNAKLAENAAQSASAARGGGMDYEPEEPDVANNPYVDPADKPGKLGGGTMGIKPDFSEVDRLDREHAAALERRPFFLGGFSGVGSIWAAKDAAYKQRRAMAQEKAIRDAMEARYDAEAAAPEKYDILPGKEGVLPSGQLLERGVRSGEVRPAFVKTQNEQVDWPAFMGAAPTQVTTEVPRTAESFQEEYLKDRLGRAEEARKNTARGEEIEALTGKEKTLIGEREASEKRIASHRAGLEKDIATHQSGLPARERSASQRVPSLKEATDVAKALVGNEYAWDALSEKERRERVAEVFQQAGGGETAEDPGRDPAQGRKIAAPAPKDGARKDGAIQRTLRDGRKVWVKKTADGKWVEVK